jgi:hypothetical protein
VAKTLELGNGLWLELGSRPKIETTPNTHLIHLWVMGEKKFNKNNSLFLLGYRHGVLLRNFVCRVLKNNSGIIF